MPEYPIAGYSTIYHLPFNNRELRQEVGYGPQNPDRALLETEYQPAETLLGITDRDRAYHHAQGEVVNEVQNARHMVRSASVGDVIEIVHPTGRREYHLIDPIGFSELDIDAPPQATNMQTYTH
jgi:hypothetical protein